jgi:hypothetical protein
MRIFPQLLPLLPLVAAPGLYAATITIPGSITGIAGAGNDQIDSWRTTTVLKTLDPDGDNVYGTSGYVLYATDAATNANTGAVVTGSPLTYNASATRRTLSSIPSFLTLTDNGQTQTASSYGYKLMDDPTFAPGASVSDLESGAALTSPIALGTEQSLLNLTIGTSFPAGGLRVGLLFSNADVFDGTIRLTQTAGGSGTATFNETVPPAGVELGMTFFDITGAAPGDVFTLYIKKTNPQPTGGNLNTNVIYGGVTFDALPAPVPEPTAGLLLALGSLGLGFRRRRG